MAYKSLKTKLYESTKDVGINSDYLNEKINEAANLLTNKSTRWTKRQAQYNSAQKEIYRGLEAGLNEGYVSKDDASAVFNALDNINNNLSNYSYLKNKVANKEKVSKRLGINKKRTDKIKDLYSIVSEDYSPVKEAEKVVTKSEISPNDIINSNEIETPYTRPTVTPLQIEGSREYNAMKAKGKSGFSRFKKRVCQGVVAVVAGALLIGSIHAYNAFADNNFAGNKGYIVQNDVPENKKYKQGSGNFFSKKKVAEEAKLEKIVEDTSAKFKKVVEKASEEGDFVKPTKETAPTSKYDAKPVEKAAGNKDNKDYMNPKDSDKVVSKKVEGKNDLGNQIVTLYNEQINVFPNSQNVKESDWSEHLKDGGNNLVNALDNFLGNGANVAYKDKNGNMIVYKDDIHTLLDGICGKNVKKDDSIVIKPVKYVWGVVSGLCNSVLRGAGETVAGVVNVTQAGLEGVLVDAPEALIGDNPVTNAIDHVIAIPADAVAAIDATIAEHTFGGTEFNKFPESVMNGIKSGGKNFNVVYIPNDIKSKIEKGTLSEKEYQKLIDACEITEKKGGAVRNIFRPAAIIASNYLVGEVMTSGGETAEAAATPAKVVSAPLRGPGRTPR